MIQIVVLQSSYAGWCWTDWWREATFRESGRGKPPGIKGWIGLRPWRMRNCWGDHRRFLGREDLWAEPWRVGKLCFFSSFRKTSWATGSKGGCRESAWLETRLGNSEGSAPAGPGARYFGERWAGLKVGKWTEAFLASLTERCSVLSFSLAETISTGTNIHFQV